MDVPEINLDVKVFREFILHAAELRKYVTNKIKNLQSELDEVQNRLDRLEDLREEIEERLFKYKEQIIESKLNRTNWSKYE